jgi:acyl carrier protein
MTDLYSSIAKAVSRVKGIREADLRKDSLIAELSLDSLDEVEVMMMLEDDLEIEVDQTQLNACKTLGDLASILENATT